jgi:hypothetical protein
MFFVVGLEACRQYPARWKPEHDAWAFSTLQEHFDSKLNPDPTKRTPEQVKILGKLQKKAKETQQLVKN